jgi:thymidine phosphorylase
MDTEQVGLAACMLGAGRERIEDNIDPAAGIVLHAKTGDHVGPGDVIATLYASTPAHLDKGESMLRDAYEFADSRPSDTPHFFARVSTDGVESLT